MYDCSTYSAYAEIYSDRLEQIYSVLKTFKWQNKNGEEIDIRYISETYFLNLCSYLKRNYDFTDKDIKTLKRARYEKQMKTT